jgi:PAS domain S-box-containing protein
MTSVEGNRPDQPAAPGTTPHSVLTSPAAMALAVAATAAGYYLGAWLALALRYPSSVHSVLWPPNAILLAGLLLLPVRVWWLALIAVLPAHILTEVSAGWPWPTILGLFVTNTAQAVLGAALVNRLARRFVTAGSFVVVFIAGAVFIAPFLISFADVGLLCLTGLADDYWSAWQERFLSNAASTIIFVPPVLAAVRGWRSRRGLRRDRCAEALLLAACFAVLGAIIVFVESISSSWLPLMLCSFLPLLLWAAVRFGKGGASCALLGLVAVTMGSVAHWPAATAAQQEILMLQAFFLLVSIPVLYLAALHGDLRQSVRALDAANQRYRMATAAGSVGVWDWNPQTGDLNLDPLLKGLLGYEDREIANRVEAWLTHIHEEDRERVQSLVDACASGEAAVFEDEHRTLHADGGTRWFLSRGRRARDGAGGAVRVLGTSIDVTERRRMADELLSLEVLWTAMLASLVEQVAIIDRSGIVIAVNEAWARFAAEDTAGLFERAPVGADYLDLCRRRGGDPAMARAAAGIAAVLAGSEVVFRMEYEHSSLSEARWFEMSVVPLRRPEGGAVVAHHDITRRKRAEIDAEQQRQELTHLTRVGILGQLSGALAHELNQPLTAILSNAQAVQRFLAREPLDVAELRAALGEIVEADRRASDVIVRLRTLLKKGEAQFRPLDLNEAVKDALDLAHSDLVVRNVATICRLAPGLPHVRADRVQIQQVLLNLIANACEAMMDTEPQSRSLTVATAVGEDRALQITVADSGCGIDARIRSRLFEPFLTTKKNGLGIGLSICSAIVAAHGGKVRAIDNLRGGATFVVTLPIPRDQGSSPG